VLVKVPGVPAQALPVLVVVVTWPVPVLKVTVTVTRVSFARPCVRMVRVFT
jgi:hypothetical protein